MPDAIQYCDKCARLIRPAEIQNSIITTAVVLCPDCAATLPADEYQKLVGATGTAKPRERRSPTRQRVAVVDGAPRPTAPSGRAGLILGVSMGVGILAGLAVALVATRGGDEEAPETIVTPAPPVAVVRTPTPAPPVVAPTPPAEPAQPAQPAPGEFTLAQRRLREVRMLIDDRLTRYASAKEAIERFLAAFPDAPEAVEVKRLQKEIAAKHLRLGDKAFLTATESAYALCANGDYDKAVATLEHLKKLHAGSEWGLARGVKNIDRMLDTIARRRETDADDAFARVDDAIERKDYAAARDRLGNTSQWPEADRARATKLLERLAELEKKQAAERQQAAAWSALLLKMHAAGPRGVAAVGEVVEAGRASVTLPAYRERLARVESRIRSSKTVESLALDNMRMSRRVVRLKWKDTPVAGRVTSADKRSIVLKPVVGNAMTIPVEELDPTDVGVASGLLKGDMAAPVDVAGYYYVRGALDAARAIVAELHSPAARDLSDDIDEMTAAIAPPAVEAPAPEKEGAASKRSLDTDPALVARWTFDDRDPERATDSSPNGNHGSHKNMVFVDDKFGGAAARFDGKRHINVPNSDSLNPARITIAAWSRPARKFSSMTATYPTILQKQQWRTQTGYMFGGLMANRDEVAFRILGEGKNLTATYGEATAGEWYHVAGVYDGTAVRLYRNGAEMASKDATTVEMEPNGIEVVIGSGYEGDLDDLRVYDRALSADEIAALASPARAATTAAASGSRSLDEDAALVAHCRLDDGGGVFPKDETGFGKPRLENADTASAWVDGKIGGALAFDGADARVVIRPHERLRYDEGVTFALWFKSENEKANQMLMAQNGRGQYLNLLLSGRRLRWETDRGQSVAVVGAVTPGEWNHAAGTWSPVDGIARLYINGTLREKEARTSDPDFTRIPVVLGKLKGAFKGAIDDVRIYARALSPEEIAQLVAMGGAAPPGAGNQPTAGNLVVNGGFEEGQKPWKWIVRGGVRVDKRILTGTAHSGDHCMRLIDRTEGKPETCPRLQQTIANVEPGKRYRLAYWCRGDDVGAAWVGGWPEGQVRSPLPEGTYDWQQKSIDFTSAAGKKEFVLVVVLEGPTNLLCIDDFSLTPIKP